MEILVNRTHDEERAFYEAHGLCLMDSAFDGPADGESAFKESDEIETHNCFFNLRYPFWHCNDVKIIDCEMTKLCRAALWYTTNVLIKNTKLHGIKALRECNDIALYECDIVSPEFGWMTKNVSAEGCVAESEYFMFRCENLNFKSVRLNGKYSFQYLKNAIFEDCELDTKDSFWHAENVTVKNCRIKGEYLAWYCKNVTFENCEIIGTQPFCYCENLRLINCSMHDADLCFEKSSVEATLTSPLISIKNPYSGHITAPKVDEIIITDERSHCEISVL